METLSPQKMTEEITALCRGGKHQDALELANACIASDLSIFHKFRAIHAIILRHQDETAALPLVENTRSLFEEAENYFRETFALYEERLLGQSSFTSTLPALEQQLLAEAKLYWHNFPSSVMVAEAKALMQNGLSPKDVEEQIWTALQCGRPFSLLRMGDGEGRFAIPLETPAVKSKTENIAKRIWFWNSNYPPESFWQDMRQAFENADIVGCNPAFRVGFEYRNSVLGYIGVVNGNRFLAGARERGAETAIAANWVLGELGTAFFEKLIASQKSVGFIGPHPGLEATLHKMGADEVQSIVIPSDNIVPNANHRPHYPDVYQEVISQIDGNAQGLWLVSAGAYGKIYCNEIKEAGGVALDIGSISDQWMKLKTR